jgi:hypothetical protein
MWECEGERRTMAGDEFQAAATERREHRDGGASKRAGESELETLSLLLMALVRRRIGKP